jgi:hypothetical protein
MRRQKAIHLFLLILPLVTFLCGFEVKRMETVSVNGAIERIDPNHNVIVVNQIKMDLSSDTRIVDEKGNAVKWDQLKPTTHLTVETVRMPDGYKVIKITVHSKE